MIPLFCMATPGWAEMMMLDDFTQPNGWSYVSDRVMGGVSDGAAAYDRFEGEPVIRLRGEVSTANNGGFIQVRRSLPDGVPGGTQGLTLRAMGNGATYYVHLHTSQSRRPWQYYAASFVAGPDWDVITLDWADFQANGRGLTGAFDPSDIRSIGLVAYGANYTADLTVAEILLR